MFFFNPTDTVLTWEHRRHVVLVFLAVVFFFIYQYISLALPALVILASEKDTPPPFLIVNQPDELSNYLFARSLALGGTLRIFDPRAAEFFHQIHPRSTTVVDNVLVPIGFPGFIVLLDLFGAWFSTLFGVESLNIVLLSMTPLLAAITPIFFYSALKRLFHRHVAFVSALLLFIFPGWWYVASRPFQHTIAFLSILILSLAAFGRWHHHTLQKNADMLRGFFVGVLAALPLFIRPSEWLWVFALWTILFWHTRRRWRVSAMLSFFAGVVSVGIIFFSVQWLVYGQPFGTGYAVPLPSGESGTFFSDPVGVSWWQALFSPFGFSLIHIIKTMYWYAFRLFPLWTLGIVFGMIGSVLWYVWTRRSWFHRAAHRLRDFFSAVSKPLLTSVWMHYAIAYVIISAWIIAMYGSWWFTDNVAGVVSIGSSQVRYLLPVFVGGLPFVALVLVWLFRQKAMLTRIGFFLIAIILFGSSAYQVVFGFEGLAHIRNTIGQYYLWQQELLAVTEEHSVIVTRYADKYLYPHRSVISGLTDVDRTAAVSELLEADIPVYWYDLDVLARDLEYKRFLYAAGLALSDPLLAWDDLSLRTIRPLEKNE